jgi:hypothetical protein
VHGSARGVSRPCESVARRMTLRAFRQFVLQLIASETERKSRSRRRQVSSDMRPTKKRKLSSAAAPGSRPNYHDGPSSPRAVAKRRPAGERSDLSREGLSHVGEALDGDGDELEAPSSSVVELSPGASLNNYV